MLDALRPPRGFSKPLIDLGTAASGGAAGAIAVNHADDLLQLGPWGIVGFVLLAALAMVLAYLGRRDELKADVAVALAPSEK